MKVAPFIMFLVISLSCFIINIIYITKSCALNLKILFCVLFPDVAMVVLLSSYLHFIRAADDDQIVSDINKLNVY